MCRSPLTLVPCGAQVLAMGTKVAARELELVGVTSHRHVATAINDIVRGQDPRVDLQPVDT